MKTRVFLKYFVRACSCSEKSVKHRCSRSQMFLKIDVLKNFAIFTGKHLSWSLISNKVVALKPATLLKRDSNTGIFL